MKQARLADAVRFVLSAAAICFVFSSASAQSFGLPSPTRVNQLAHTAWRVQDGAFTGIPGSIAQTMDGYLWIGTNNGLARFDGVRFVPWAPPSPGATTLDVTTLLASKDGSLWIGTSSRMLRLKDGHVTDYTDVLGRVDAIVEDAHGTIWYARARSTDGNGPLCKVTGSSIECFGKESGIDSSYAGPLCPNNNYSVVRVCARGWRNVYRHLGRSRLCAGRDAFVRSRRRLTALVWSDVAVVHGSRPRRKVY